MPQAPLTPRPLPAAITPEQIAAAMRALGLPVGPEHPYVSVLISSTSVRVNFDHAPEHRHGAYTIPITRG